MWWRTTTGVMHNLFWPSAMSTRRGLVGHCGKGVLAIESSTSHMIVVVEWYVQCLLPSLLEATSQCEHPTETYFSCEPEHG